MSYWLVTTATETGFKTSVVAGSIADFVIANLKERINESLVFTLALTEEQYEEIRRNKFIKGDSP